jgi:hypothetical protein
MIRNSAIKAEFAIDILSKYADFLRNFNKMRQFFLNWCIFQVYNHAPDRRAQLYDHENQNAMLISDYPFPLLPDFLL